MQRKAILSDTTNKTELRKKTFHMDSDAKLSSGMKPETEMC